MSFWTRATKFDRDCCALADRHYSRRKIGAPQFMPPGETLILKGAGINAQGAPAGALFGWWRPHPRSGIKALNGLDGWTCTIFRNESIERSSDLILEAEYWLTEHASSCGPDGLLTYVWDARIASVNPGYCFKRAGWFARSRSADGKKTLLRKPFGQAGLCAH